MKNDEHFGERGLAPNVLANIRMANEQTIFRTEKTISKQNSRIEVWRERNLAKAPPGYSVNLEGPRGHPPEEVTTPDKVQNPVGDKYQLFTNLYNEKNMVINKKITIQIFTNVSKFYKMKKQILLFVLFVVATFASISKSYGQNCTPGELNPAAGTEYAYSVTATGTGTNAAYVWYVTKDVDLLKASAILTPGASAGLGDFTVKSGETYSATTTSNTIHLTWNPVAIASTDPYYLVVKYSENATNGGCTLNNIKVFRIQPINSFLLAVTGAADVAGATETYTCAAPVSSAIVTPGAAGTNTGTVAYEYGQNTLYYKVTASGVVGKWRPSISLPALTGSAKGQNYVSADWTTVGGTSWTPFAGLSAGDLDGGTFTSTASDADATTAGTSIIVRIVVENKNYETLADQTITLGVDGYLASGYTISDIKSTTDCNAEDAFGKHADKIIQKRPTVVTGSGTVPLMTQNP